MHIQDKETNVNFFIYFHVNYYCTYILRIIYVNVILAWENVLIQKNSVLRNKFDDIILYNLRGGEEGGRN